ncbi:MAG: thiamine pyrophosphate-dependent dehydrogenase E1 component subunit alpha, partial [Candidatus Ranarchaeia archaeon]
MSLPPEKRIDIYRKMLLARRFEETVEKKKIQGTVKGFVHLGIGQEAVGVGLATALEPSDYLQITHRGHGYAIAKGVPSKEVMAELYGKETGCCKARGGSMHIGSWKHGVLGCNAILGANVVYTAGVALASKLQKTGNVVISILGDGATNTGAVHEGYNLAAVWDLPIVYVIENNLYAISTHISKSTKLKNLADRAKAYGMPGVVADGMDVEAVYAAVVPAVKRAREGKGPTLIELKTYRFCGGAVGDKELYRTKEEVKEWSKKDPLRLGQQLVEEG